MSLSLISKMIIGGVLHLLSARKSGVAADDRHQ